MVGRDPPRSGECRAGYRRKPVTTAKSADGAANDGYRGRHVRCSDRHGRRALAGTAAFDSHPRPGPRPGV